MGTSGDAIMTRRPRSGMEEKWQPTRRSDQGVESRQLKSQKLTIPPESARMKMTKVNPAMPGSQIMNRKLWTQKKTPRKRFWTRISPKTMDGQHICVYKVAYRMLPFG